MIELLGEPAQRVDALGGNMSANVAALSSIEPQGDIDRRRLQITGATIAEPLTATVHPPHR